MHGQTIVNSPDADIYYVVETVFLSITSFRSLTGIALGSCILCVDMTCVHDVFMTYETMTVYCCRRNKRTSDRSVLLKVLTLSEFLDSSFIIKRTNHQHSLFGKAQNSCQNRPSTRFENVR